MAAEHVGYMVCKPVMSHDWVIPDFLMWTNPKLICVGPDFVVRGETFYILLLTNLPRDYVRVRFGKRSKHPIFLNHLSLSLIGDD
jgi:hypothetical protein